MEIDKKGQISQKKVELLERAKLVAKSVQWKQIGQ